MAITARYWRVRETVPPANNLTFGEFQFAAAGNSASQVSIAGLALSTTVVPSTGAVNAINDGNLATTVGWTPTGALQITWDFGSDRTIGAYRCVSEAT